MRRHLCTQVLPRLRTQGSTPKPILVTILARKLSTGNQVPPRSRRDESATSASCEDPPLETSEARPFAVERIGGRECLISWSGAGEGIQKQWRDVASPEAAEGKVVPASTNSLTGRISSWLGQMFLPTNYPQSVHRSYLPFHILQAFETTLATVTSVLCNQALLTSVGVSAEGSFFGAVAVQWIIKDGAGEVAKLFFIRRFSPFFDSHPKAFTLFGEVLGCLGSGLQIATVLIAPSPVNFLLCAAGGNIFKLVGSAIWFTTHIKFIRYFSMQGNDGDVAAKDESQASVAQLAGYAAGISLLTVSHSPAFLYSIFFVAVPLHLTMTALMMRGASFELLTLPRVSYLAQAYVRDREVCSVDELDRKDVTGPFGEFYKSKSDQWLKLGQRATDVLQSNSDVDRDVWEVCSQAFQHERYLLLPHDSPRGPLVSVLFHPEASNDDMLRSIFHAALVRQALSVEAKVTSGSMSTRGRSDLSPFLYEPSLSATLEHTHELVERDFSAFKQALDEHGWRTDELCFADHGYRVTWTP